jgi:hypothetical protein
MIVLYHRTRSASAEAIQSGGFSDRTDYYMTDTLHSGVWFSDRPLDEQEGASGEVLLSLRVPESAVAPYEWVEEGKPYREWLIPASLANAFLSTLTVEADELPAVGR